MKSATLSISLFFCFSGQLYAEDYYQDENGVWTNRPRSGSFEKAGTEVFQGLHGAAEAGFLGLTHLLAAPGQQAVKNIFADVQKSSERHSNESKRKENLKKIEEINQRNRKFDIKEYEQFDTSSAGEVKSEWEFFEDPR
ncbi:hypothetical protein C4J81_10355 [Deltaproteobacteria bacterium Smac51]|nr:hypothetical protein C4J81_10355 [Deltaproteobacteria bacterium Smac51]